MTRPPAARYVLARLARAADIPVDADKAAGVMVTGGSGGVPPRLKSLPAVAGGPSLPPGPSPGDRGWGEGRTEAPPSSPSGSEATGVPLTPVAWVPAVAMFAGRRGGVGGWGSGEGGAGWGGATGGGGRGGAGRGGGTTEAVAAPSACNRMRNTPAPGAAPPVPPPAMDVCCPGLHTNTVGSTGSRRGLGRPASQHGSTRVQVRTGERGVG